MAWDVLHLNGRDRSGLLQILNDRDLDLFEILGAVGVLHVGGTNIELVVRMVKQNLQDSSKTYSLPINYYTEGLIYNRDLFKKAGLDPDKPPTTWDEVEADAAKISALGGGVSGYEDYSGGNTGGWHFAGEIDSLGGADGQLRRHQGRLQQRPGQAGPADGCTTCA